MLGVHFTSDVLGGWLAGGLLLATFIKWEKPVAAWVGGIHYEMQLAIGAVSSLVILAVSYLFLGLRSGWTPPADWLANAPDLNPLDPTGWLRWQASGWGSVSAWRGGITSTGCCNRVRP